MPDFILESLSGIVASGTTIVGVLPQIYKSYKIKSASDVSMIMLVNFLVCAIAWIIYGLCINSRFVVYSNIVVSIFSAISVIQKIIYDKHENSNYKKSVDL